MCVCVCVYVCVYTFIYVASFRDVLLRQIRIPHIGWLQLVGSLNLDKTTEDELICYPPLLLRQIRIPHIGWLQLVGSLKLYVSFAEYSLFYRALLQKKSMILRSLLIVATP